MLDEKRLNIKHLNKKFKFIYKFNVIIIKVNLLKSIIKIYFIILVIFLIHSFIPTVEPELLQLFLNNHSRDRES